MKILKVVWGLILFGALIAVVQLADPGANSPATLFQRLPAANLRALAEAEWAAGHGETALLLLDYISENRLPDQPAATELRQRIFTQLAADNTAAHRIQATGWAATLASANAYDNLAGSTVADAVLDGDIAELARQGRLASAGDAFQSLAAMTTVFPPAEGALRLTQAASAAGALNESLDRQLRRLTTAIQADPKTPIAVEKFKENFMPLLELAKRCRTWGEFATLLRQADSPDQLRVLTKIVATSPSAARHLSQVLAVAARDSRATASTALDYLLQQGPTGLPTLHLAVAKGAAGLKLVTENPTLTPAALRRVAPQSGMQSRYETWRQQYGAGVTAAKYLVIAALSALLVLVVIPGRYLEKLIARPGGPVAAPGAIHYLLSALAVGIVLAGLAYLLSLAVNREIAPPGAMATGAAVEAHSADSAFLSGTMVLLSLAIHAAVWFYVRGKIRQVEDDESPAEFRLRRLDNLDVFLDLPLFTGLALTVIAFILITLDAGMSRHFAYTATVVGILSAVSLRIRYLYPLKERLIRS